MKKLLLLIFSIYVTCPAIYAYQDCIIINKAKLTDINIEDNTVVDVYPLTTLMNDKNTLIVHPLKSGKTRFCVLKNNKNLALFNVEVSEYNTNVNAPEGFDVFTLDPPDEIEEYDFVLDLPPLDITNNLNEG